MGMNARQNEIAGLEKEFWDSMIQGKPEVATQMLTELAVMVSGHGATKFDHAAYIKMAQDDRYKLVDYEMSEMDVVFPTEDVAVATYHVRQEMEMTGKPMQMDVYDTSTWVKVDGRWRCVMHTESPQAAKPH
jgi:ketosteroid isomerase-like protein